MSFMILYTLLTFSMPRAIFKPAGAWTGALFKQ